MARQDSQIAAFTNANWNHGARLQRMEAVVAQLPSAALAQRIAQLEMAMSTLVPGHKQVWYNSTDKKDSTLSGACIVARSLEHGKYGSRLSGSCTRLKNAAMTLNVQRSNCLGCRFQKGLRQAVTEHWKLMLLSTMYNAWD